MRDKTYVRIDNGMLFNVTGYEHPIGAVFASLKYTSGKKWVEGYDAARQFLLSTDPSLVDANGYIRIPVNRIESVFDPFVRWQELLQGRNVGFLHQGALDLATIWGRVLDDCDFGITDSLLWGAGAPHSDIDLVVRGLNVAQRILCNAESIYKLPGFERPCPLRMAAPYGLNVIDWPRVLSRKLHMGCYRNRLFSLRVVLCEFEIGPSRNWGVVSPSVTIEFQVFDASEALQFPAIYRNKAGDELVDYSVAFEGVFRHGDRVHCECEHLSDQGETETPKNRFVLKRVIRF